MTHNTHISPEKHLKETKTNDNQANRTCRGEERRRETERHTQQRERKREIQRDRQRRARDDTDEGEEVHEENTYQLHGPERAPSVAAAR